MRFDAPKLVVSIQPSMIGSVSSKARAKVADVDDKHEGSIDDKCAIIDNDNNDTYRDDGGCDSKQTSVRVSVQSDDVTSPAKSSRKTLTPLVKHLTSFVDDHGGEQPDGRLSGRSPKKEPSVRPSVYSRQHSWLNKQMSRMSSIFMSGKFGDVLVGDSDTAAGVPEAEPKLVLAPKPAEAKSIEPKPTEPPVDREPTADPTAGRPVSSRMSFERLLRGEWDWAGDQDAQGGTPAAWKATTPAFSTLDVTCCWSRR